MNIVSLFDGMGCGMLAMTGAGVTVDNYWAYEIDKYAVKTAVHNFPEIQECGDVFEADFSQYKDIDFLIGGSPCTYWSIAQKNNRETEASGMGWELFSQYVRALRDIKPEYFIYENNKSMSKAIRKSISETFGFDAVCINSALVSAQNRQRLYWVGRRNSDGTYSKVDVRQPKDKGISLKDILDSGYDLTSNDKGRTLTASYNGGVLWNTIERSQRNMVAEPCCIQEQVYGRKANDDGTYDRRYEARSDSKSGTITTTNRQNSIAEPVEFNKPIQVGALPRPNGELSTSQGFRIYDINSKSVTLKGNAGGAGGKTGLYAVPIEFKNGIPTKAVSSSDGKTYTLYQVVNSQITIKDKTYPIKLSDGYYIIRKLTVRECKRLQTVPDWYEFPVSNTQAYKILGNGWTVDVITHLIKSCLKGEKIN